MWHGVVAIMNGRVKCLIKGVIGGWGCGDMGQELMEAIFSGLHHGSETGLE